MPTPLGSHLSEEHKRRIRNTLIKFRKKNPVYVSEESRVKMRIAHIGKKASEQTRKKMSVSQSGKIMSAGARRKISIAKSGSKHHFYGKFGVDNPNFGLKRSIETRNKIRAYRLGKHHSQEQRDKVSAAVSGSNNPMYGKRHSQDTIRKIRLAAFERIQRDGFQRFGKNETLLLDKQERMDGIKILRQHPISILGYIVDGYCPETNTVYEVYENRHNRKSRFQHDILRQQEICGLLNCRFVVIQDGQV